MPDRQLLPQSNDPCVERRDVARNRSALMESVLALIDEVGVEVVTMDAVAARAGVGKGTVFRHFGNREGLMSAVMNESEAGWQEAVITGPAPLGPGAPAWDRLEAFCRSRLAISSTHGALLRATGSQGSRSAPAFGFHLMHVQLLMRELGVTGDLVTLSRLVVSALSIDEVDVARAGGIDDDRFTASWLRLVEGLVATSRPERA